MKALRWTRTWVRKPQQTNTIESSVCGMKVEGKKGSQEDQHVV